MTVSDVPVTPGSGANVATYSITESTLTKQIQRVTANDSTGAEILGLQTDAAATQTDATALSLMQVFKQISKTLQAAAAAASTAFFSKITDGTNTVAVKAASTAPGTTDPALVVAISPNSVNANGRNTPTNSAPVVMASQSYQSVPASSTATALSGGGGGAVGDWLDFIEIIPASTSPGAVSITDGTGSAITVFAGGASSVASLVPFSVPVRAVSSSGAWKVTTGASVSVLASGNFH